jgi:serine/threonine-protein kinase
MPTREKFGKFVLLQQMEACGLGVEYRAAKLSPSGLDKIVTILRVRPDLSANAETVKSLMDQVKYAAQLQNPNIVKLYGIGKVEASFYISHEFIEGKSLQSVFTRGRQDGFPFSVDHALLIVSKVCSALEYAHGRKTEGGARYFHGMVTPANVVVSYEGEVRTRGFGYWPARVREAGGLTDDESLFLAPEQAAGGVGDTRSDLFAVGALLFQMLTGEPFFQGEREIDFAKRLADAKLLNPTSEDEALPKPIREVLRKSLTQDPGARYAEVQEMRKGVDTLLFSGDFSPTTFNLAFFMHSLFREDIDRESKTLDEERAASYAEYITEDVKSAPRTSPGMPVPSAAAIAAAGAAMSPAAPSSAVATATPVPIAGPEIVAPAASVERHTAVPTPVTPAAAIPAAVHSHAAATATHAGATASHAAVPAAAATPAGGGHGAGGHGSHATPASAGAHPVAHPPEAVSARAAAAGLTFHRDGAARNTTLVWGGVAAAVLIAVVAAAFGLKGRRAPAPPPATAPPTTMSAEAVAALARVKELEEKLQALEAEKAAASARAEDEARKKVEAQAAARGQAADPAAVARAQEEARKKSQAEQERKAEAERRRLEEEQRIAEAELAEEKRRAEEAKLAAIVPATLPPPPVVLAEPSVPPPTTVPAPPAIKPGALVDVNELGVIAPVALNKPFLSYPPIALRQRVEGKVDLSVLVDERGGVADAKVVGAAGGRAGLNEAARDYVRRWKFRPATKEGVPVKTWTPVSVVFMLPR